MSLLPPLSVPKFITTAVLIFTFFWMVFGSSAHSQTAARFISNQQWEAEVEITFSPTVRDREPKIDRLLADRLLKKLKVQRVTYDPPETDRSGGWFELRAPVVGECEGWGQFRKGSVHGDQSDYPVYRWTGPAGTDWNRQTGRAAGA